tara:strand:- start:111 stop:365 length:255 start_codon:yes stop_codon:yes gene_type:complete
MKNALGGLFGKKLELQNLGFAELKAAYHQSQLDRLPPMPEVNMSSFNDGSTGISSSGHISHNLAGGSKSMTTINGAPQYVALLI